MYAKKYESMKTIAVTTFQRVSVHLNQRNMSKYCLNLYLTPKNWPIDQLANWPIGQISFYFNCVDSIMPFDNALSNDFGGL